MSFFGQTDDIDIEMINPGETTSLSSGRSLLFRPQSTSAWVETLKNNKKKVAGSVGTFLVVVVMSATFIGMQHSSTSVFPAQSPPSHNVIVHSKTEDKYLEEPVAMALNTKDESAVRREQRPTTLPPPTTTRKNNLMTHPVRDLNVGQVKNPDAESVTIQMPKPIGTLTDDVQVDQPVELKKRLEQLKALVEEHAVPPSPPRTVKIPDLPKNATTMHAKSLINEMHLPNQTYWRYNCLEGRSIVGFKSVLTFVYNDTIYEFIGYGKKLKEAETEAAERAAHSLWNINYARRAGLLENDMKLCPKTPTLEAQLSQKTNEEIQRVLGEFYSQLRASSFIQVEGPRIKTPKKELPKDPLKLDPKSLVLQMQLESFDSHKLECLNGRSTVGFKCILTFVYNGRIREFEGHGKRWKDAEKEAARKVCLEIWGVHYEPVDSKMSEEEIALCPPTPPPPSTS